MGVKSLFGQTYYFIPVLRMRDKIIFVDDQNHQILKKLSLYTTKIDNSLK
ncbi:hypothetical protein ACINWC141_3692 [Acinetobacter sp. WC-141]|nr:hypothetical protein ACINWC141_3692 [Acinetobacter sp. WC-141]